ncbi:carbamoyl-phosphate synthase large subunit [Pasteurella canis]|nr:carbamoyl-phosphate synthase large subunit [Pasteurella canis]
MEKIGLSTPKSFVCHTFDEAWAAQAEVGFPTLIRPSFTMGGSGGGIAYNKDEFYAICERGFDASPTHELLIEQSVWVGKNMKWRSYVIKLIIALSCAQLKILIRWGCIPVTQLP